MNKKPRTKEELIAQIKKDLCQGKNLKHRGPHKLSVKFVKPQTESWKNMKSCCCDRKIFKLIAFGFYTKSFGVKARFKHTRFYAICKTHFNQLKALIK